MRRRSKRWASYNPRTKEPGLNTERSGASQQGAQHTTPCAPCGRKWLDRANHSVPVNVGKPSRLPLGSRDQSRRAKEAADAKGCCQEAAAEPAAAEAKQLEPEPELCRPEGLSARPMAAAEPRPFVCDRSPRSSFRSALAGRPKPPSIAWRPSRRLPWFCVAMRGDPTGRLSNSTRLICSCGVIRPLHGWRAVGGSDGFCRTALAASRFRAAARKHRALGKLVLPAA